MFRTMLSRNEFPRNFTGSYDSGSGGNNCGFIVNPRADAPSSLSRELRGVFQWRGAVRTLALFILIPQSVAGQSS